MKIVVLFRRKLAELAVVIIILTTSPCLEGKNNRFLVRYEAGKE